MQSFPAHDAVSAAQGRKQGVNELFRHPQPTTLISVTSYKLKPQVNNGASWLLRMRLEINCLMTQIKAWNFVIRVVIRILCVVFRVYLTARLRIST
jgi:hypothetical protein